MPAAAAAGAVAFAAEEAGVPAFMPEVGANVLIDEGADALAGFALAAAAELPPESLDSSSATRFSSCSMRSSIHCSRSVSPGAGFAGSADLAAGFVLESELLASSGVPSVA